MSNAVCRAAFLSSKNLHLKKYRTLYFTDYFQDDVVCREFLIEHIK